MLVVLKDKGQDFDHLPVAARPLEKVALQALEGFWQIDEGRAIAQGAGFALDHRQIMAPVINRSPGQVVGSLDDPLMFA